MFKSLLYASIILQTCSVCAQGPYAPAAGQSGATAIHRDSSIIMDWCSFVSFEAGYLDIADKAQGQVGTANTLNSEGYADGAVLSLGDSGITVLEFNQPIYDGPGPDFAIFENSFSDTFLELAKVFVSSDGINFVEFPSHSNTPDTAGIGGFGSLNPSDLHNLAGKYRAQYGTPFDLSDISDSMDINPGVVTHVKIIDCVGTDDELYATLDSYGNKIIDPYPTNFPSGGFDLDAVAAINVSLFANVDEKEFSVQCYPNPSSDIVRIKATEKVRYEMYSLDGQLVIANQFPSDIHTVDVSDLPSGMYIMVVTNEHNSSYSSKISVYQ